MKLFGGRFDTSRYNGTGCEVYDCANQLIIFTGKYYHGKGITFICIIFGTDYRLSN